MAKQCSKCGASFASDTCPACGTSASPSFFRSKVLWIAVGTLGLILVLGWAAKLSPSAAPKQPDFIEAGKRSLVEVLRDPDSVNFGDVWVGRMERDGKVAQVACGYYNAKNGFGGMTGMQRFMAGADRSLVIVDSTLGKEIMDRMWQTICVAGREG